MNQPTREDPVATALSEVVGGPVGARARPHRWWTPVRVLLAVFSVVFALGLVQKYPCGKTDWSNNDVRYSKMCYSDVPYLYTGRGFAEQHWPYADSHGRYPAMEYPVLISYLAWGASELTSVVASGPSAAVRAAAPTNALWGLPGMTKEINTYFLVTALLLFGFGLGTVFFLSGASPGRPWDAMAFALSPALLLTGLVNWDLLAVFFTAGALWGWARGKPVLAGVMVGLGTAAKLYPLFLLGAFLVDVIWRKPGRSGAREPLAAADLGRFGLAAAGAAGAWLVANLPAIAGSPDLWKVFWSFNSERAADLGSLWLVLNQAGAHTDAHLINTVSWIAFGAACVAILLLGLRAPQRPRVAQIGFLIVAAFLIVNKVYSPQYVLWLLPLAVLARPRWRDLLIWQVGELTYFAAVWLYLGGWLAPASGDNAPTYQLAILIRVAAELYLVVLVVRDVMAGRPGYPEVRDSGDDDVVHVGRGEPDPDGDLVADGRRLDP